MSCTYHSDRSAVNTCVRCGSWLCDGCSVTIDGQVICKSCIAKEFDKPGADSAFGHGSMHGGGGHGYGYGFGGHPHPHGLPPYHGRGAAPRVSGFLLLLFSALPGANYMYMGLIKRGLCMMAAFFGSIYITGMFGGMPFAFLIPILAVTSLFDGFRVRRLLNAGEKVEDNINDVRQFIREHRAMLTVAVGVLIGIHLLNSLNRLLHSMAIFQFGSRVLMPWLFIGLGCYFVFRRKKAYAEAQEDVIDKRGQTQESQQDEQQ